MESSLDAFMNKEKLALPCSHALYDTGKGPGTCGCGSHARAITLHVHALLTNFNPMVERASGKALRQRLEGAVTRDPRRKGVHANYSSP